MAKQQSKAEPVTMVIRGRLAFVHTFKPMDPMQPGADPKYSVSIMIPNKDPQLKTIRAVIDKMANDEWGPGSSKKLGTVYKTILRDGAERSDDYPEFAGHHFINASSKIRPGVVIKEGDTNREVISQEDCYSGVEAQVQVNFYVYNNVSKGVSAGLNNVRVLRKLEAFSGRERAEAVEWGATPDLDKDETEEDTDAMLA